MAGPPWLNLRFSLVRHEPFSLNHQYVNLIVFKEFLCDDTLHEFELDDLL